MAGTEVNGSNGSGTAIQPGFGEIFDELPLEAHSVADATTAPGDSPDVDTVRIQVDETPHVFIWIYWVSNGNWFGVEVTK